MELVTGLGARVELMYARDQPSVVVDWERPQRALSWAIYNGGLTQAQSLAICQIRNADLPEAVDPTSLLRERTAALGRSAAIGLLTSADVTRAGFELAEVCGARAGALATVGLGNALRVGDAPTAAVTGTINIACWVDAPLTPEALLEAVSIVVAARTLVVLEAHVQSTVSDGRATGTGTDCVVMSCPWSDDAPPHRYSGMHTGIGSAIGRAVSGAVSASLSRCSTPRGASA